MDSIESPQADPTGEQEKIIGALLGTALGDALGIAVEGMSGAAVAKRFGRIDRFRLLGKSGFVSDDTEQSALVAQSLCRFPTDSAKCARDFRRSLLGWFLRLPWGVGLATVRACLRIICGFRDSGVSSAGNGAAMRAGIVGALFHDNQPKRLEFGTLIARVTHTHPMAVGGALFAAELTASCVRERSDCDRTEVCSEAAEVIAEPEMSAAIRCALELAGSPVGIEQAAAELGTTGYILHTIPFAVFCFVRYGADPMTALTEAIGAGGDTDTIAAILGCWVGALHGETALPGALIGRMNAGPFGPTHLRLLGECLSRIRRGEPYRIPGYFAPAALLRNLALYPIILGHGLLRLLR